MDNFWKKLSKREKIVLIVGCGLSIAAVLDIVVVSPINSNIQALEREIKVSEKQLSINLRNLGQKEFVKKEYERYSRYVGEVGSEEEETAKILSEIETLARKEGMYLRDIKPHPPKVVGFQKEYNVDIKVEGKIAIIVQFLYQLNASSQLLRAEKIRVSLKDGDSSILKASMVISKILII